MESYEVIIVGAGPGGLHCAEILAKAGRKVIVLEKNSVVGPKACAGGLPRHTFEYLGIPEKLVEKKFKEICLHTPYSTKVIKSRKPLVYTIQREKLGRWQLHNAKEAGVLVRTRAKVTKILKDHVIIDHNKKLRFKYLVGADGVASIVRRHLGLRTKYVGATYQYNIPTTRYKNLELFFGPKLFRPRHFYIFPHKDRVFIGCGKFPPIFRTKNLKEDFNNWLEKKNIDISNAEFQAASFNSDFRGYKFNNVFLVGDAAGLTSGLTGEGVYQALVSGEEVAKIIIDNNYVSKIMLKLIHKHRMHLWALMFFEMFFPIRPLAYKLMGGMIKKECL
ncbi:MAG: NAD(P)/FAD-dependent oxidoreductase [archaeon]